MAERNIRPNDTVLHRPSGETWKVAGVNFSTGELVPFGEDFPKAVPIAECELVKKGYEFESQSLETIRAFQKHDMQNFIDMRSAMWHGLI